MRITGHRMHHDITDAMGIEYGAQACEHRIGMHRRITPRRHQQITLIGRQWCRGRNAERNTNDWGRNRPLFEQRPALIK